LAITLLAVGGVAVAPAAARAETTGPSCAAQLNYIHKSTSAATFGKVKVYGATTCNAPMTSISVSVQLYRIVDGQYVLIGESPDPTDSGVPSIGRSAVGDTCVPGDYYAQSQHSAILGSYGFSDTHSEYQTIDCS
jgi:hypothetical protein